MAIEAEMNLESSREVSSTLAELEESRRQTNITSNVYATRTTHSSVAAATFNDFRLVAERVPEIRFSGRYLCGISQKWVEGKVEHYVYLFFAKFLSYLRVFSMFCSAFGVLYFENHQILCQKFSKKCCNALFNLS